MVSSENALFLDTENVHVHRDCSYIVTCPNRVDHLLKLYITDKIEMPPLPLRVNSTKQSKVYHCILLPSCLSVHPCRRVPSVRVFPVMWTHFI